MAKKIKCWNCGEPVDRIIYSENTVTHCCKCGCIYPEKPKLEAMLTVYQDKYLQDRTSENREMLFKPMKDLTFNIICSKLKKSQGRPYEDIEDMTNWTLLKLWEYYSKPNFKITGSFTGYISKMVLFPLYNAKDKEKSKIEISIYSPLKEDSEKTIMDCLEDVQDDSNFETAIFNTIDKDNLIIELNVLLKQVFKKSFEVGGMKKCLKIALLFKHLINGKSDKFFSEWWNSSDDFDLQNNYFQCVEIFKKLLRNNIRVS